MVNGGPIGSGCASQPDIPAITPLTPHAPECPSLYRLRGRRFGTTTSLRSNRKWSILCRLQERGGLPALAVGGLLTRAALVSGGQFLVPAQGDFISPNPTALVWGSSLGALGPDTTISLSPTQGSVSHPLLCPISTPRRDNHALLRTL